jgi:hypothetical protein
MPKGTLDTIALELSRALDPLADRLTPDEILDFLAELGLQFPPALQTEGAFLGAMASAAGQIAALVPLVSKLIDAIESDDDGAMIEVTAQILEVVSQLLPALDTVATKLHDLAGSLPGITAADVTAFAGALAESLASYVVVNYLEGYHPTLLQFFAFAGIIELNDNPGVPGDATKPPYTEKRLRFDNIAAFINTPDNYFQTLYDWGNPTFDGSKLLERTHALLSSLSIPASYDPGAIPPALRLLLLTLAADTTVAPRGLKASIDIDVPTDFSFSIPIFDGQWALELDVNGDVAGDTGILIQPPANISVIPPAGEVTGKVTSGIARIPLPPDDHFLILGGAGSGLTAARISLALLFSFSWDSASGQAKGDFGFQGQIKGGHLHIGTDGSDGFIAKLLSGVNLDSDFELGFEWTAGSGFHFTGSAALEIQLPAHISLGPIDISGLTLSLGFQDSKFPLGLAADISASLGPLDASVEQIGASVVLSFPADGHGNVGPVQLDFAFKPPKGAGLEINAGVVVGGGYLYFDPDKGEYAGVAQLSIADIVTVTAIALIATKMPDGSNGFSLLLILTTDFPPIQLGFGFTLNGVGGLLGLNRTAMLDVLRDGVRTGAVDDIMFPTDVIANAPRIISDLKAVFPPQEGVFLVGPMAKLGWGSPSLITLAIGIILEIPPGNIAILGVLKLALPTDDETLIQIQVNFIGILDFDEQLLSFDASIYDSYVLFMTLQGDMAVRLKWGGNAAFLISVGGFHPLFKPPDGLHLPATMKRMSITILDYDWAKISADTYFAVTSNTVQFGAHLILFFGVDDASINGQLGLDVLFQFSPFYFLALISGSLSISVAGFDLLSIDLKFSLEGPSPWRAKGTGSISICWFLSVDVDFDVTWGDAKDTSLPPIDVFPIFLAEIDKQGNWKALPPPSTNLLVTLRAVDPPLLILHPFGELTLSQRALPLNLTLDKVGNDKPDDVNRVDITGVASGPMQLPLSDHQEQFAIAQFQDMGDNDKLSRPSYQDLKGGVVIGTAATLNSSKMARRTIAYSVTIIDKEPKKPLQKGQYYRAIGGLFHPFLSGAAVARSPLSYQKKSQLRPFTDQIAVSPEGYTVSNTNDNKSFNSSSEFSSEAMARDYMSSQLKANPALAGTVHVLPGSEVNAA